VQLKMACLLMRWLLGLTVPMFSGDSGEERSSPAWTVFAVLCEGRAVASHDRS
jgi:hypothetical protein